MACGPVSSCAPTPPPPPVYTPPPYIPPPPPPPVVTVPPPFICLPYLCTPPPPPPAPPPPPPVTDPFVHGYWGSDTVFQIPQALIDEWATDLQNDPSGGTVYVYHGSIDNGTVIKALGLDPLIAAYVSTDERVAVDTVCNSYHLPNYRTGFDRWIVRSQIPWDIYYKYFNPYEVGYAGWTGTLPGTTQIQGMNSVQTKLFDYGIDNWGVNLLPQPQQAANADIPPGCGPGYYALPYAQS